MIALKSIVLFCAIAAIISYISCERQRKYAYNDAASMDVFNAWTRNLLTTILLSAATISATIILFVYF